MLCIDPDSEVAVFAKRTVRDLKLPPAFITQIASSIQVNGIARLPIPLLVLVDFDTLIALFIHSYVLFVGLCLPVAASRISIT